MSLRFSFVSGAPFCSTIWHGRHKIGRQSAALAKPSLYVFQFFTLNTPRNAIYIFVAEQHFAAITSATPRKTSYIFVYVAWLTRWRLLQIKRVRLIGGRTFFLLCMWRKVL